MSRTTAAYKLKEGLASTVFEDIGEVLKSTCFSLNVDECFSNSNENVFSILVSYFS